MWNSNLHYNLIQKGAGKYEDSEEAKKAKSNPNPNLKTRPKGTKGDKGAFSSHVSLFFSNTRVGVARR